MFYFSYRGFGVFLVMAIYGGGMFLTSRLAGGFSDTGQITALAVSHVVLTAINYGVARFLNRNEIKHTVYRLKLQTIVLIFGLLLGSLIVMMLVSYLGDR